MSQAVKNYPNESCAFLFADKPFSEQEDWHVFPIKNISETPTESWIPDKKEMLKVKAKAKKLKLTKIGNIHSHPIHQGDCISLEDLIQEYKQPSNVDLKFARKFNDTIRGIIVVGKDAIYEQHFHDQYGNTVELLTEELREDEN